MLGEQPVAPLASLQLGALVRAERVIAVQQSSQQPARDRDESQALQRADKGPGVRVGEEQAGDLVAEGDPQHGDHDVGEDDRPRRQRQGAASSRSDARRDIDRRHRAAALHPWSLARRGLDGPLPNDGAVTGRELPPADVKEPAGR